MKHKIITHPKPISRHHKALAILIFMGFSLLTVYIFASSLSPHYLTAKAVNASTATRVNVLNSTQYTCNTTIPAGTTLTSFPCITILFPLQDFLDNLSAGGDNVHVIFKYNPNRPGRWDVYNATLPSYATNTFSTFSRNDGIYITMDAPEQFYYQGYLTSSPTINLRAGWNLVGYPSIIDRTIANALSSISANYYLIRTLEGTLPGARYENRSDGSGNLTNTSIYHGYWINMTTADTWVLS